MISYKDLGSEVGELVDEKNTAYGNSFNVAEDFIKLLWPNGVPTESFNDMLCVVRIFDKLKRIATNKGYGGESPYRDICGYALLGLMKDQRKPFNAYTQEELDKVYAAGDLQVDVPTTWTPAELVPEEEPTPVFDYNGIHPPTKKCIGCDEMNIYAHCPIHSLYPPVNYPLSDKTVRAKKSKKNKKKA